MTSQDFLTAWASDRHDNPLARFRQDMQSLQGYGELILEDIAADGFRPRVAPVLEDIRRECRGLTRALNDLLASSDSFSDATTRIYHGLHPTLDTMIRRIQRMIQEDSKEPFAPDLKNMHAAARSLRTLLDEIRQPSDV